MPASDTPASDGDQAPWGPDDLSVGTLLDRRAAEDPGFALLRFEGREITAAELAARVDRVAAGLQALGVGPGERVPVMLPNHPDYVAVFFALLKQGACQVPVNVHLRGEGLRFILSHADAKVMIVDERYAPEVEPLLPALGLDAVVWRGRPGAPHDLAALIEAPPSGPVPCRAGPGDEVMISYTSGTTGLPKGAVLTDRMLRVCARAAARLAEVRGGDVFFLWEPLYHIGGAEVLILAAMERITVAMVERFSVSRFWGEVRAAGATHIHFLGGVLALLLKEPPRSDDRDHPVRLAWGGGCPVTVWRAFEERFGIPIRECYGMTECSSFTTQNLDGKVGSIGKPLPWFEVTIADDEGRALGPGARGEIVVRERVPGLIMSGYFNNPEATAATLKDGALHSGDVGWFDDEGYFYFAGRKKDSIRRRGENITAFEIERVANEHPAVAESGAVGVPSELGDEDVKLFLKLKPDAALNPLDFIAWCEGRLARFQIPRFIAFIDAFPKTPSERIRKDALPRDVEGVFDLERSGYRQRRG